MPEGLKVVVADNGGTVSSQI